MDQSHVHKGVSHTFPIPFLYNLSYQNQHLAASDIIVLQSIMTSVHIPIPWIRVWELNFCHRSLLPSTTKVEQCTLHMLGVSGSPSGYVRYGTYMMRKYQSFPSFDSGQILNLCTSQIPQISEDFPGGTSQHTPQSDEIAQHDCRT